MRHTQPRRIAPLAGFASLAYAAAVLGWIALGHPYPLGAGTRPSPDLLSSGWPWEPAAGVAVAAALAGAGLGALLSRRRAPSALLTGGAVAFAAAVALAFLTLIAESGMLAVAGYLPLLVVKAFSDPAWFDGRDIPWDQFVNEYAVLAVAGLWAGAAVVAVRENRGRCAACGRRDTHDGAPRSPRHWVTFATWTAVAIPLVYATTRFAWVAGIPLGINATAYASLRDEAGSRPPPVSRRWPLWAPPSRGASWPGGASGSPRGCHGSAAGGSHPSRP
ncbi:hypothetical protein RBS60_05585 [Sinomonas sp. ASV486]|uniref:hypothetical protein n=1 Tax=Sinomonas sp. ASV486 TaxID=3051170 RepID=UPI0027DBDF33|nr:hypothetical protein [Sinomonas sp. ASV486]MDQ4489666.1 hypothetical protein [Sinomonas sp. ASV486]